MWSRSKGAGLRRDVKAKGWHVQQSFSLARLSSCIKEFVQVLSAAWIHFSCWESARTWFVDYTRLSLRLALQPANRMVLTALTERMTPRAIRWILHVATDVGLE